jgi:predicted DCC family thiol-disulfide oxidoreductase YuxK
MDDNNNQTAILFYDSECTLCLRFKQSLDRLPGTDVIIKKSVREESTFTDYPQLDRQNCLKEVHLLKPDGTIIKGSDVITFLLEQFPGVKHFAWLIESEMGQKAVAFFNDTVEQYRKAMVNQCGGCNK